MILFKVGLFLLDGVVGGEAVLYAVDDMSSLFERMGLRQLPCGKDRDNL